MKKLMLSLIVCLAAYSNNMICDHSKSDLFDAIKELDIDKVKHIIQDKAHSINKEELKEHLAELKAKITGPILADLPWYRRYDTLAKIGIGAVGTILSARFLAQAVELNPEPGVPVSSVTSRFFSAQPAGNVVGAPSVHAPLCVMSGAVGALSLHAVITGVKQLFEYRNALKAYTIRALAKQALKAI